MLGVDLGYYWFHRMSHGQTNISTSAACTLTLLSCNQTVMWKSHQRSTYCVNVHLSKSLSPCSTYIQSVMIVTVDV